MHRFKLDRNVKVEKKKLRQLKSLDILAHSIYYKFFSDRGRIPIQSDIIDVLIMTSTPYIHTFISEKNAIDILNKIKKQTKAIERLNLLTLSQLQ